LTCVRDY